MSKQGEFIPLFRPGSVVKANPATDKFMRGDVYGVVTKIGRKYIHVRMTRSGRTVRFHPDNLLTEVSA